MSFTMEPIGIVHADENGFWIEIESQFRPALQGIEGFGYVQVLWWFDYCDKPNAAVSSGNPSPIHTAQKHLAPSPHAPPSAPTPLQ